VRAIPRSIANEFYRGGRRWRRILKANRDKVDDPRNLQVDVILMIP
jgi:nucleoid-associated protein YgaU